MPRKPIRETIKDCPEAAGEAACAAVAQEPARARGGSPVAPATRRESTVRRILAEGRDPLQELARLMATSADPKLRLEAARALAPFVYPTMKAVEVSGPGGERLVVEVRKEPAA